MTFPNMYNARLEQVCAHGGTGKIKFCRMMNKSDFQGDWNFVDYAVLPPQTSIGLHQHGSNEEVYIILEGEGLITLDGRQHPVARGDLILNPPYGTHGLLNPSNDKELSILVIEIESASTKE